jgi:hypothetical protein
MESTGMSGIVELYGHQATAAVDWNKIASDQICPLLGRKCLKNRKSEPEKTIGSCVVSHQERDLLICPHRLLEQRIIFRDCIHLLTKHEPGNEYHVVAEIGTPAGNIDYILASVRKGRVVDFVGIELQTLDTTGTLYPHRERFLAALGKVDVDAAIMQSNKPFGINWKMTAKTILMQLHHKIEFFEKTNKHLVLVLQDHLLAYMRKQFNFQHFEQPSLGNAMHLHSYTMQTTNTSSLQLTERISTDAAGVAACLNLNFANKVSVQEVLSKIQSKISRATLLKI